MSEKNFVEALRAAVARDVACAPAQHRLQTPQCPPLARLGTDAATWSSEEQAHIAQCSYCQKVLAMLAALHEEEERGRMIPSEKVAS